MTQLARLQLARLRLARSRRQPDVALGPDESRLQVLTAELPEARAIARIDRERTLQALTIDVLGDTDE